MPQDDPPREAVETLVEGNFPFAPRISALKGMANLRTLPAAARADLIVWLVAGMDDDARWRLIARLAEGLEVTEAMLSAVCREAGCDEDSFSAGMVTMTAARNLRSMLAAARAEEARDG